MATLNEEIQNQLKRIQDGEIDRLTVSTQSCSIGYIRNCVAASPYGEFSVRQIKGTNTAEIIKKDPKKLKIIDAGKFEDIEPEEDIQILEEDFLGPLE